MEDRRSNFKYCTFFLGNLVTWKSRKQTIIVRSSVEAKLKAIAHDICELLWLKCLLEKSSVT